MKFPGEAAERVARALLQAGPSTAAELADATIYARDARKATLLYERQAAIEEELTGTLERWEQLESGSRA